MASRPVRNKLCRFMPLSRCPHALRFQTPTRVPSFGHWRAPGLASLQKPSPQQSCTRQQAVEKFGGFPGAQSWRCQVELIYFALRSLGQLPQMCLEFAGYPYMLKVVTSDPWLHLCCRST